MYLNAHSYYSYKYGVMSPTDLLQEAKFAGLNAFVLADVNSTSGCIGFVREAPKYGIRPIIGIDCRDGVDQKFVAIAKNNEGFQELNAFVSPKLHGEEKMPDRAAVFKNVIVIYPFEKGPTQKLRKNEFVGVRPQDLLKLPFSKWNARLDKLVILQPATFRYRENLRVNIDFNIHRLLRAIDKNVLLSKLPKSEEAQPTDQLLPKAQLLKIYEDYPELIENTQRIIDSCDIHFEIGDGYPHKNIKIYSDNLEGDFELMRSECLKNLHYRYSKPDFKIYRRLALELQLIKEKGFISYFLVNWDMINYARKQGFFYIGRGSGANSIVAYLLRITDVDPIDLDLYFERFMNLYRKNPPDFDIDFSWRDREDVTEYLFDRFGWDRVCLVATYNTFQYRAVIRELGKVFGLPSHEIEALSGRAKDYIKSDVNTDDSIVQLILRYAKRMHGMPSHLSVHASGIIISDRPIHYFTATSMPPKGFPITHFDMVDAEDVGLYKFDILSQRGLGKIKDTLEIIKKNYPEQEKIDIHDTKRFFQDEKVKGMLRNGQAIGCFYVESPAMRMLLKKLRADHYLGLVAASSVIRPGVAKSGMMRQYILRFRQPERRKDAHPVLAGLMPETFGVMVYQEDVIKVAHYFGGLTLGEADRLRRGMSGKYRSRTEFQLVKDQFFKKCREKEYSEKLIFDVWRQIESFAGYAFAKGHSASYAIESYQCLFLKAYYPLEYLTAVINNGGGFYSIELYIHESRMHGAKIEAPEINLSQNETTIKDSTIFLGFHIMKDIEARTIYEILQKRNELGEFKSLEQFVNHVFIGLEQLKLLIRVGAFRSIESNKKKLLWESHMLLSKTKKRVQTAQLFEVTAKKYELPILHYDTREDAFDEMEILKFPLCNPFELIEERPAQFVWAKDLHQHVGKIVTMIGYLVTIKHTATSRGDSMHFGTFVDEQGLFIDTVHFPPVAKKFPFQGKGIYDLTGLVVEEFEFYSLEITEMKKINYVRLDEHGPLPEELLFMNKRRRRKSLI